MPASTASPSSVWPGAKGTSDVTRPPISRDPQSALASRLPMVRIAGTACSPPSTPRMQVSKKHLVMSPPPRPRENELLTAIRSNRPELIMAAISEDENLVHIPVHTIDGCEAPILVALKEGCSAAALRCLLRSGASIFDVDNADRSALEIIAAIPAKKDAAWGVLQGVGPWDAISADLKGVLLPIEAGGGVADEDRRCACARLLLARGAGAAWGGAAVAAAAAAAEEGGARRLASLIRHWSDVQTLRWLRELRWRSPAASGIHGPSLLGCPPDVWKLVCEALAPQEPVQILSGSAQSDARS
mmetsp:Transcript_103569/g.322728  ORF Transcript_103569/g.322728 Transcript_103569/m.322728 type:complete len:301 (+) Transcript_103569:195-1097(+)